MLDWPTMEIRSELVDFLTSGVSLLVGTRDPDNVPACVRAMGAIVAPDRRSLTVLLPVATADRTLANLRDNGRIAVTFSRIIDHRGVQIKGQCLAIRPATADEERVQRAYADAWFAALEEIGLPRATTARLAVTPGVAIEVRPETVFEQTPGPSAGRVLEQPRP